jgi:hypothetical protein
MRLPLVVPAVLLFGPACLFGGPATGPTTAPARSPEAAKLYRQAFAQLEGLSETDSGRLGLCGSEGCWVVTTPLDAGTADLVTRQRPAIELARKAGSLPATRWDLDGDAQRMVDLSNRAPRLSALMVLDAREALRKGNPGQAMDDLVAAFALARQVASETTLLTKMVEMACWRPAAELLAEQLPTLPRDLVAKFPERLRALPPSPTMQDLVRGEHVFAKASAAKQGIPIRLMIGSLGRFYEALAAGADKPPAEFDKLVDAEAAKVPANVWAEIIAPQFKRSRETVAVFEAKQAMLATAIAVTLDGEKAAAASKDPFAEGPFGFRKTSTGFELTSGLRYKDAPVKLVVGKAQAAK